MKKLILGVMLMALTMSFANAKTLIVYYSKTGGTRAIAEYIQKAVSADIFEIQPVVPYPEEYRATTEQAKKEINTGYRPAIKEKVTNLADYNTVFIGSPVWWGTIALPVTTFLAEHDLSDKTVIPFVTHGGGGISNVEKDIAKLAPRAALLPGQAFSGGAAEQDVVKWVNKVWKNKK
ncbi:MAG: flavodoxin [Candidatus Margulisbacteria bacterium]|jgi:flavodoxin|nr:flavodoxin [Candidatus Margulisiibacteriota bacterium]